MPVVQKYGGTSLETPERIRSAARRAAELSRQGRKVVIVVSAQGDTTDHLIARAKELSAGAPGREMDALLACGERMSAALMAMAIEAAGCRAVSLTGAQAGIRTDSVHGDARITHVDPSGIHEALDAGKVVVVAGFQGISPEGEITTLGRGGSDTTAVALAAALGAKTCQIYTDVDGVYDRDPRRYPDASRYEKISCAEMLEKARSGAQVLHDRCVELAMEKGVAIEVLSAFTGAPGTVVE